jgi:DNA-binding MarR family transcriptional regulator
MSSEILSPQCDQPIRDALTASNDLVCALCAPAAARGLDALSCRVLLVLAQTDGLTTTALADHVGLQHEEVEGELDGLERAGHLRRATREREAIVRLTPQGRATSAQLIASARPERFAALHPEITSLRDLLCRALYAAEREVSARQAA